jgi:hypothetical protein
MMKYFSLSRTYKAELFLPSLTHFLSFDEDEEEEQKNIKLSKRGEKYLSSCAISKNHIEFQPAKNVSLAHWKFQCEKRKKRMKKKNLEQRKAGKAHWRKHIFVTHNSAAHQSKHTNKTYIIIYIFCSPLFYGECKEWKIYIFFLTVFTVWKFSCMWHGLRLKLLEKKNY